MKPWDGVTAKNYPFKIFSFFVKKKKKEEDIYGTIYTEWTEKENSSLLSHVTFTILIQGYTASEREN